MDITPDVLASEILEVIPEVMRIIRIEMRSRRSFDMSVMQFRAMVFIRSYPGSSLSALAEHLGLSLATVSQMIDGMVANHLVRRDDCATDRRRVELSLTEMGESLIESAYRGTQARLVDFMEGLTPAEGETIHQAMNLLQGLFTHTAIHQANQEKERG